MNINELNKVFEKGCKELTAAIDSFPWEDRMAYATWLSQTYYLTAHTTRYMALMAGLMGTEMEQEHVYMCQKLREETGHSKLATNDLKRLDFNIASFPELTATAVIPPTQYYWIQRGFFGHYGYFWLLEQVAADVGVGLIKKIEGAYGPKTATFLQIHAVHDQDHAAEVHEKIKTLSPEVYPWIAKNIETSVFLYSQMLEEIKVCSRSVKKSA